MAQDCGTSDATDPLTVESGGSGSLPSSSTTDPSNVSSIPLQRMIRQPNISPTPPARSDEQQPPDHQTPPSLCSQSQVPHLNVLQQQRQQHNLPQNGTTKSAAGTLYSSPLSTSNSESLPTHSSAAIATMTSACEDTTNQQGSLNRANTHPTLSWRKRVQQHVNPRSASNGFVWESLDESMNDVQQARKLRRKGATRFFGRYHETSYNTIRETFRLQNSERRKGDITNLFGFIRLLPDYDLFAAKFTGFLTSKAGIILFIMMDLVVDVLFCGLYLAEVQVWVNFLIDGDTTTYPDPMWLFVPRPRSMWVIALTMSSWNIVSAIIRFITSDNKLRFIFSLQTLLDAVTALPFLISTAFLPDGQYIYVPYFLRSWSVLSRLQRALSIGVEIGITDQPFDPVKAKLVGLIALLIAILYNAMCAFMYCEMTFSPGVTTLSILDAFYYILITGSTVGYGDITPKSNASKVVVMVFIIVALAVLPGLIAGTIDTIKSSRAGGGSYSQSWGRNGNRKKYLVLIGNFQNARRVHDMLNGFFNKEFSDGDVRIVFLSRVKPSKDVKTLLELPTYKNKSTMLVGNGLEEADLKRCQVKDSSGVFIIPEEQNSTERENEDTMTTLLAWSIHLYSPQTPIYTYNLLPETESFQWGIVEKSVCIADIKQLLLAYNCRHQGTGTLILNLLLPSEPANSYEYGWQAQYGDSSGNEIYVAAVPEVFVGWTFAQVAWLVFHEFQCTLIGVDIFLSQDILNGTRTTTARDPPYSLAIPRVSTSSSGHRHRWRGAQASHQNLNITSQGSSLPSTPSSHFDISKLNIASSSADGHHLTLNPGNSYRLGSKDHLVFIAQSPNDIEAIAQFTMEQYERLATDERGFYQEADRDFSKAMDQHFHLYSSRADARAAARQRAEVKASIRAAKEKTRQEMMAASSCSAIDTGHFVPTKLPESMSTMSRQSKDTSVPATGDEPTGRAATADPESSHLADSPLPQTSERPQSPIIAIQRPGHYPTRSRFLNTQYREDSSNSGSSSCKAVSGDYGTKAHPTYNGSLNEQGDVGGTTISQSDGGPPVVESLEMQSRNLSKDNAGGFEEDVGVRDDYERPNSAFERNAAAAAALMEDEYSMSPDLASFITEADGNGILRDHRHFSALPETPTLAGGTSAAKERPQKYLRVRESFRKLDETTYIGQAPIARSDAKDLPLCHLLINPPKSIHSQIKEDLSRLKNHVLVCSPPGEDLYRFIATLRLAPISKEDLRTIVVLTKNPLEAYIHGTGKNAEGEEDEAFAAAAADNDGEDHWNAILAFPRVYWISGNCRHQRDLVRAGLLGADKIVVMSHTNKGQGNLDEFADSVAIMANHMIFQTLYQRGLLGRQSIVVELEESTNIRFLSMRPDLADFFDYSKVSDQKHHAVHHHFQQRQGATGASTDLFTPTRTPYASTTSLDVMSAPKQYSSSPHPGSVIKYGGHGISLRTSQFIMSPIYASGQVLVGSLLDNVLFQAYTKRHIIDLIKMCCGVRLKQAIELDQLLGIDCSHVCLIDTPPQFIGKSYLRMFQELALVHGTVPLGLFRAPDRQLGNALPFVFTNPLPGILLKPGDKIYSLRP